ncbi:MAG: hypothetical protein IJM30_09435 [Thermoguttaceae bacterium]|nr:hypothetical protein [Thermoguttaceae bacterium]
MDPSFYFTDYGDELDEAVEEGRRKRFWKRFIVYVVVLATLGAIAGLVVHRYSAPIDMEKATRDKAIGWLVIRDLTTEPPETKEKLFDLYLGGVSIPDPDNPAEVDYALPEGAKKFSGLFLSGRDDKVAEWRANRIRAPYLRVDYLLAPEKRRPGAPILSTDVVPSPSLERAISERREELARGRAKKPNAEKNVQFLVMQWFLTKAKAYDATPDAQKKARLDADVDELLRFQRFYNGIRESARKAPLTRVQALREFEMTMDGWLDFAEPDELARALWYKDVLETGAARQIGGGDAGKLFDGVPWPPTWASGEKTAPEKPKFEESPFGKALEFLRDKALEPKK